MYKTIMYIHKDERLYPKHNIERLERIFIRQNCFSLPFTTVFTLTDSEPRS